MKIKHFWIAALTGALLTIPQMAVMFLANRIAAQPFVPFDLFDWITPRLPGPVITFGIDAMIDGLQLLGLDVAATAKTAEQLLAMLVYLCLGIVAGVVLEGILEQLHPPATPLIGGGIGVLFGLPAIAISISRLEGGVNPVVAGTWLLTLFLAWAVLFASARQRLNAVSLRTAENEARSVQVISRRQFLITLGARAATVTVVGAGLAALLGRDERPGRESNPEAGLAQPTDEAAPRIFPNADDPVVPAPGTRLEFTPVEDHYKVFIKLVPPEIDEATWRLPITGLVDHPLLLSLDDIRNHYPAHEAYITLSCIYGDVGTTLISTTLWTGARLQDILADAGVQPEARFLQITSGDGYYETLSLDLLESDGRILFCYAWDGSPLPVDHGFPLRIWIPDRFGMKQPKWITGVEVTSEYAEGYWVRRGWDEVARVKTTSVIDTVAVDAILEVGEERRVPVGGIAWAGDRGISSVEVRVDGGDWQPGRLRAPLSATTWVIWRYDWPFQPGHHLFEVRCTDGNGAPQIERRADVRPSGATGIHQRQADL